jgi:hypothetical protein
MPTRQNVDTSNCRPFSPDKVRHFGMVDNMTCQQFDKSTFFCVDIITVDIVTVGMLEVDTAPLGFWS